MKNTGENSPRKNPLEKKEAVIKLGALFVEAETALAVEGRDRAITFLPRIYDDLIALNKRDKKNWKITWVWNPRGDLTREQFDALNLKRKQLSNAIGIMTASGVVRHDLNKI